VLDLADRAGVDALLEDVDAVIHLGGISVDAPFDALLEANIRGVYNLYAAAQKHGVKRVLFASSNHATGFHPATEVIDADAPLRPDSLYGVTKCFGESLSRYYYDRFGLETVCIRIGSSFEAPKNPRMLVTYLSYRDFVELVRCSLFTNRDRLRRVGQSRAVVGQPEGRVPRLPAAGQFHAVRKPLRVAGAHR
jgi:uronate dehydrogenase